MKWNLLAKIACGFALAIPPVQAGPVLPTFTGLGSLSGSNSSMASAISADGSTVVGESGDQAFVWTKSGGMKSLGVNDGRPSATSANGSVIVGFQRLAVGTAAFRWTAATGAVNLGDLPGGATNALASAVTPDGTTIVGQSSSAATGDYTEMFIWTAGTGMVGLGAIPSILPNSRASAISPDGKTVYGTSNVDIPPPSNGVVGTAIGWTQADGFKQIGPIVGNDSIFQNVSRVSADGKVLIGQGNIDTNALAVRYTAATGVQSLGDLPGGFVNSAALGVNKDGSLIVGWSNTKGVFGQEAMIWDAANGMRKLSDVLTGYGLNLNGWTLIEATGISDDGNTITGWGRNSLGQIEAFLLTVPLVDVPEPTSLALFAVAMLGGAGHRFRKRRIATLPD